MTDHSVEANKMVDPFREAARQAAREDVARRHDIAQWAAAKIRSGDLDDEADVNDALTGADAALAAIAPLIRAQCAEVAMAEAEVGQYSLDHHGGSAWDRTVWSARHDAARSIERAILALATTPEPAAAIERITLGGDHG